MVTLLYDGRRETGHILNPCVRATSVVVYVGDSPKIGLAKLQSNEVLTAVLYLYFLALHII